MFIFLPGNHQLSYQLAFASIDYLSLSALNDSVIIICTQSGNLLLEAIQQVHIIGNVDFAGCSMNRMLSITYVTLVNSKFTKQLQDSSNLTLEIADVYAIITDCIFSAEVIEMSYSSGTLLVSRSIILFQWLIVYLLEMVVKVVALSS